MELRDIGEIQGQVAKLLKINAIVSFKSIKGPIIEEIND